VTIVFHDSKDFFPVTLVDGMMYTLPSSLVERARVLPTEVYQLAWLDAQPPTSRPCKPWVSLAPMGEARGRYDSELRRAPTTAAPQAPPVVPPAQASVYPGYVWIDQVTRP